MSEYRLGALREVVSDKQVAVEYAKTLLKRAEDALAKAKEDYLEESLKDAATPLPGGFSIRPG